MAPGGYPTEDELHQPLQVFYMYKYIKSYMHLLLEIFITFYTG